MQLKKAIFDMDGLIFDSERLFMKYLGEAMEKEGYILTRSIYEGSLGLDAQRVTEYMKGIYGKDYPVYEMGQRARESMKADAQKGLPVKSGIPELLEYLTSNGVSCVVASSTEGRFVRSYLESAGLIGYFSKCIGGDAVKESKPNPEIFLKALGDSAKSDAIIFEDSENGVKAAVNAEIRVICIPDMKCPNEEILKKAYACVKDAYEAIDILERNGNVGK